MTAFVGMAKVAFGLDAHAAMTSPNRNGVLLYVSDQRSSDEPRFVLLDLACRLLIQHGFSRLPRLDAICALRRRFR
ncbi:MAG TPA: hypothetical protein VGH11_04050, partial [Jatrophihabitans sp.]